MAKMLFAVTILMIALVSCKTSHIKSNRFYHVKGRGPSLYLYTDSVFIFHFIASNNLNYSGPPAFPKNYFRSNGRWTIKKGKIILTSNTDSTAHAIRPSHSAKNPYIEKASDPRFSTIVFNDLWGDTVNILAISTSGKDQQPIPDSVSKFYKIDLTTNPGVLTFFFHHYRPYTFKASEIINKNYSIELQPVYSSHFFKGDSVEITRKKVVDLKRKLTLEKR